MMESEKPDSSGTDETVLLQDAADLRASPAFSSVLRDYTLALVEFREDPRVINKLISRDARFRVVNYLLYLHASKVLAGEGGGVTYGQMLGLCTSQPDIGVRVLKTMLSMLSLTRNVHVTRDALDRRVKIYTPTDKLFAVVHVRLAPIIAALAVLQPDIPRAAALQNDPLFLMRAVEAHGRLHAAWGLQLYHLAVLTDFAGSREGAGPVIYTVMLSDLDATPLPSIAAMAKRFGLSKTQVWSVLTEGECEGYFAKTETATFVATDKLRDQYSIWTSIELAFSTRVLALE